MNKTRSHLKESDHDDCDYISLHDYDLLVELLNLCLPQRRSCEISKLLLNEKKTLPRAISADRNTLDRIGVPRCAQEIFIIFRKTIAATLRRSAVNPFQLNGWSSLIDYLHVSMAHNEYEHLRVLFLDNNNNLVADEVMSEGTVNQVAIYTRDIVKRALELNATSLIMAHTHPSGSVKPSRDDIQMTNLVRDATRVLGIVLHDHVIISDRECSSFRALGLL